MKRLLMHTFFVAFPAFRHTNYQRYFIGQIISLTGTWVQMVAQGWLVWEVTHSAFWVGTVIALGSLPILFLTPFGGVLVDRYSKRKIIFITNSFAMVLSLVLGLATIFHVVNIFFVSIIALLGGIGDAVDKPARQAYVIEMVGKEDLASAVALNSGIYNAARAIGPVLASVLIAVIGVGGAFLMNSLSFLAVLIALYNIRTKPLPNREHEHPLTALREGVIYAATHPAVRVLLLLAGISAVFGWSFSTLSPVLIDKVFHRGAGQLWLLYTPFGIGALFAILIVSTFAKYVSPLRFILGGNAVFAIALIAFSFTNSLFLALLLLFFAGFGLIMQAATTNTTLQHMVSDHMRGRLMSLYILMFVGMSPLGSFQIGFMAEHYGSQVAIRIGAIIVFVFGIFIFVLRKKIAQSYKNDWEKKPTAAFGIQ